MTRLRILIWRSDMVATRFSLALAGMVWAALLAWPGALFAPGRTTYRLMAEVASEEVWAAAFAVQAGVMWWALLTAARSRWVWFFDGLLGIVLWTSATVLCFASHWQVGVPYAPPAAMSAEVALMLASWWHFIRLPFVFGEGPK